MNPNRNRTQYTPKPVQRVELSEKHVGLRFALLALLILIALISIGYGVASLFSKEEGWERIEPVTAETSCASDFVLLYHLGAGEASPKAESRLVNGVYSQAVVKAYQLFTDAESFEGLHNVRYINEHPNEKVEIDPALYQAFSQVVESGDRSIYLAPVYARYDDLFDCTDDSQTADFDPYVNPEVAAEYAELAAHARDKDAVDLELLGNNTVLLHVSEAYRQAIEAADCESYIDFLWLKNAFIADFLADALIAAGHTHGTISSYDGFLRNLEDGEDAFSLNLYDRVEGEVFAAGKMSYKGPAALVYLRDYGVNAPDSGRFYEYATGEIRGPYLDIADGKPKAARSDLVCYSHTLSCAEVLLAMLPCYVTEEFSAEAVGALSVKDIYTVYCEDSVILHNDPAVTFTDLYRDGSRAYRDSLF